MKTQQILLLIALLMTSLNGLGQFWGGNGSGYTSGLGGGQGQCATSSTQMVQACRFYALPSGSQIVTSSGTYFDTIPNVANCDSFLTILVTIDTVDVAVLQSQGQLTANQTAANYQWLDCNNGFASISGAINSSFTAMQSGNYAVAIDLNGCIDTSACYNVIVVGLKPANLGYDVELYPNPSNGTLLLKFSEMLNSFEVTIRDLNGKILFAETGRYSDYFQIDFKGSAGHYFLELQGEVGPKITKRFVKYE